MALGAPDLTRLGVRLLRVERAPEAAAFRLAFEAKATSATAHRGLADAYHRLGERALAVRHYRRVTELDPQDQMAAQLLAILEVPEIPEIPIPEERLRASVGAYRSAMGLLTVSRRGDRLFARLGESPVGELLPRSAEKFYLPNLGPEITFVSGEEGCSSHLLPRLRGEETRAESPVMLPRPTSADGLTNMTGDKCTETREGAVEGRGAPESASAIRVAETASLSRARLGAEDTPP